MWVLQNLKLADKPFELFNVLKSWWWCYAVRVEKWIKWHVCHRYQEMWGQCLSYRGLHEVVKYPLEAHRSLVLVLFIPMSFILARMDEIFFIRFCNSFIRSNSPVKDRKNENRNYISKKIFASALKILTNKWVNLLSSFSMRVKCELG